MRNEEVLLLFPSPVFKYSGLGLDNHALLTEIMNGPGKDFFRNSAPGNFTSADHMLQERSALKPLVDAIEARADHAFRSHLAYEYEGLFVNTMWCNVQRPEPVSAHFPHEHANAFFSGTYYVEINDDRSPIMFDTPLRSKVISPMKSEQNELNAIQRAVPVKSGDLLIWPAEMRHSVPPWNSGARRVSISFNIMLRGPIGGPTWSNVY